MVILSATRQSSTLNLICRGVQPLGQPEFKTFHSALVIFHREGWRLWLLPRHGINTTQLSGLEPALTEPQVVEL